MHIICIGYFDKFSRFFVGIEKALNSHGVKTTFQILSIHLSGFLYTWFRNKKGFWLPYKVWKQARNNKQYYLKISQTSTHYRSINFNELILFHLKINKPTLEQALQIQALSYIDLFFDLFETQQPQAILVIGDSRLSIQTAIAVAEQLGISILYIEKGPFNTTILDAKGVNANASVKQQLEHQSIDDSAETDVSWIKNKQDNYWRLPLYRIADFTYDLLFSQQTFYPPDLLNTDVKRLSNKRTLAPTPSNSKKAQHTLLLIFQIPNDVNSILHSPYIDNHLDLLQSVHSNLPQNANLVIREHPLYQGLYNSRVYEYLNEHNIEVDNKKPLTIALQEASVVIVNNSTVGLEAISQFKKMVVLGDAFYAHPDICLTYDGKDLKELLQNALNFEVNTTKNKAFLNLIKNHMLVEGSITDTNLMAAKTIAQHLKSNLL